MNVSTIPDSYRAMFSHLDDIDIAVLRILGDAVKLVDDRKPTDNTVRVLMAAIDAIERPYRPQ